MKSRKGNFKFQKLFFAFLVFVLICFVFWIFINKKNGIENIKYMDIVMKYSEIHELDPSLILGIINVESNFNENALSHKGARGLMQIMPETGEWIAKTLSLEYDVDMLYEPEFNIRLGTWYIKHLIELHEGNLELALASYNAGPGNVESWLNNPEYSIDGKNLDTIPFKETREYVKKVIYKLGYYEEILG